jgi:hypothetical protein
VIFTYDTEFLEDGSTIDLISIGIVNERAEEYYAVNADMQVSRIKTHPWLLNHVWPSLPLTYWQNWGGDIAKTSLDYADPRVKPHEQIADEVGAFLLNYAEHPWGQPELWANYSAYDHVVLAQLWGPMSDLPDGIPMCTFDIQQARAFAPARTVYPEQGAGEHNALEDAWHNFRTLQALGLIR